MRSPSSPGQGGASRPGISFWNLLQKTIRPPLLRDGGSGCGGLQELMIVDSISRVNRTGSEREMSGSCVVNHGVGIPSIHGANRDARHGLARNINVLARLGNQ